MAFTDRLRRTRLFPALLSTLALAAFSAGTLAGNAGLVDAWTDMVRNLKPGAEGEKPKPGQPKPYFGELPSLAAINVRDAVVTDVASGLRYPWAMEFLNDGELLVTQFRGVMVRIDLASGKRFNISGLPELPEPRNQVGLYDVALHPRFADNGLIAFSHAVTKESPSGPVFATAVTRARLADDRLHDVRRILVAEPYAGQRSNFGGALAFDDDGWLYVTTGDRTSRTYPQQLNALPGKILRIDMDGKAHPDNPFTGRDDADPRIFAYGVRNPQGLEFDPVGGGLFEAEHGPMGGDEINYIEPGRNYGWPIISYGANYMFREIGGGTRMADMEQPLYYYLPSIAVSPLTRYSGSMFPEWEGDLLVGALIAQHVNKLDLVDGRIRSEQRILTELDDRVRDIKVAADGSIYFLLQNRGAVVRLHRDADATARGLEKKSKRSGQDVYLTICASCHNLDSPDIPNGADTAEWSRRLGKGKATLYKNALEGIGDMPAKGFCESCSDKEIRAAVDYILKRSRARAP